MSPFPFQLIETSSSAFHFPLPEEMNFSDEHLHVEWWSDQYRQVLLELRKKEVDWKASQSFHQRSLLREQALKEQIAKLQSSENLLQKSLLKQQELQQKIVDLEAKLRQKEEALFSTSSEKSTAKQESQTTSSSKVRGQQKKNPGPKRRDHSHLPEKEVFEDLSEDQKCCPTCHLKFSEFPTTEDSEELEIEVKAYRRKIKRKRYQKNCQCEMTPQFTTAPVSPKLIPKGKIGISIWVSLLLSKYLHYQPTYRFISQWENQGLSLSQGTLTQGMHSLLPLLTPLYEAISEKQLDDSHWHADETRWQVFETVEGKKGHRWYLWVVCSSSAITYLIDPTRAAKVIEDHLEGGEGILSVDRYSAYKAAAKVLPILLAFCWAHVRRDFITIASSYPLYKDWALHWIQNIALLYQLNKQRSQCLLHSKEYLAAENQLREQLEQMDLLFRAQLQDQGLSEVQEKVLISLWDHWEGLTLFLYYPEVPMDNNLAERAIRGPVIARKGYFGSGAVWNALLAATCFSLFQTLQLYKINPQMWLTEYFTACAQAGGKLPENVNDFLPWNLTEEQKVQWNIDPPFKNTS